MIATTTLEQRHPCFGPEHEALRRTVERFVLEQVLPRADAWEESGMVPREVLRALGELGLLWIRFESRWGGS